MSTSAPEGSCRHGTPYRWACEECAEEIDREIEADFAKDGLTVRMRGGQGRSSSELIQRGVGMFLELAFLILLGTLVFSFIHSCAELQDANTKAPVRSP